MANLRQPLLIVPDRNQELDKEVASQQSQGFQRHFRTDAQRSAWIMLFVTVAMFVDASVNMYFATRYFLSSALYVSGAFVGIIGCWIFVRSSYPEAIVASCFYKNSSIQPPPGSWWLRVHFGTSVLRGGHFQLWGSVLFAASCAIWIQEDYTEDHMQEYLIVIGSSFLLVSACYYQLLAQYPQAIRNRAHSTDSTTGLTRSDFLAKHFGSDIQLSGWFFAALATSWLLTSAVCFDDQSDEEESPPMSEWDWRAFFHCFEAFFLDLGAYFLLAQAYSEGSRTDALLIAQATHVPSNKLEEGRPPHPLLEVTDLTDSRKILRCARSLADSVEWQLEEENDLFRVWSHKTAHAVKFESGNFEDLSPLLVAAALHSESFKKYQHANCSVVGKLALRDGTSTTMYFEKFGPNPPMPAHEALFASLLHESRRPDGSEAAELVEWAPHTGDHQKEMLRVNPFRFYSAGSSVLTATVWLEEIAGWMPDFLLRAEMKKIPSIVRELDSFLRKQQTVVSKELTFWIWQKIHNSISPLAAAVLVRTAPSYRVLLAKQAGLRTKIPETISVSSGPMGHPLLHFPSSILQGLPDSELAILIKHASDFASTEFGNWVMEEPKMTAGRPKLNIWRMELEDEPVRPFRIQARIHGVDPLTLATIIHRNKLDGLIAGSKSDQRRGSNPSMSTIGPLASGMVDIEYGGITVNSVLEADYGAVKIYTDRKRRTKYMPTARDREFTFASIVKDVSPMKAVVVHWGVDLNAKSTVSSSIVCLRKFQVWTLENEGGTDTKLTWCGLVPVGGRMEKVSALVSSDLKEKLKHMEKLVNLFAIDSVAKDAVAETHAYIGYTTLRMAMGKELKKLAMNYLAENSDDYKALIAEIQPVENSNVMGFAEELAATSKLRSRKSLPYDDETSVFSSNVTIPLSPVPSHLRLCPEDDESDHEVANERQAR